MLSAIKWMVGSIWKFFNYSLLILCSIFNKNAQKNKSKKDGLINNKINDKKKIMILVSKICKGGAERSAVNVAENLSKEYDVVIVMPQIEEDFKKFEDYNCNVKHVEIKGSNKVKITRKIKKFKKENGITHCISFGTRVNFINAITRVNEKQIISIRNYLSLSEPEFKKKLKCKISSMLCDYIVAVSKSVELNQIKNYNINPNKICTISNYCNKEYIEKSIQNYDIDNQDKLLFENNKNSKIVINVGKLKMQKGQWHLIRAFKKVVEKYEDAKLIILGTGELEEYLKQLITDMHLENNIFLLGHKNKNIYTYMFKSNVFVFPTLFEGMPNVILEAMACGLPIVATDCYGGNKEIIAPNLAIDENVTQTEKCEYGILIPKLDMRMYKAHEELTKQEIMLSEAICEMLENDKLLEEYKLKSLERINDYSKEDYAEQWKKVLNKI